jgi:hypothetical protein
MSITCLLSGERRTLSKLRSTSRFESTSPNTRKARCITTPSGWRATWMNFLA